MNANPTPQHLPPLPPKAPAAPKKPPLEYTLRDTLFAYLCIPVCFLFVKSNPLSSSALGTLLSVLISIAFALTYFFLSGIRPSVWAWVTGGVMLTLSVGFLTNANDTLRTFLSLGLMLLLLVFVHTCCKKDLFKNLSQNPVSRFFGGVIVLPVTSLTENLPVFVPQKNGKKSRVLPILGWCLLED